MLTTISAGRRSAVISAFIFMFITFSGVLYAESIFLKDGSIVEGKITKEDDNNIELMLTSGEIQQIARVNILRTLYHYKYKDKKFLNKTDGTEIEAYIIDEDAENYIIRTNLNSPDEMKISRNDIKSISKERIPKEVYAPPAGYYLRGIVPGWGQFYSGHYIKSGIVGISFMGSSVWAVKANMRYKKSKKDYESLPAGSTQEQLDSAFNKSKDDGKVALLSILTTSFIYALNWIDIVYFSKPESEIDLSSISCGEVYVNLNIIPDFFNQDLADYSGGLKAEVNVFIRF